jgi:hypothetical protein
MVTASPPRRPDQPTAPESGYRHSGQGQHGCQAGSNPCSARRDAGGLGHQARACLAVGGYIAEIDVSGGGQRL